MALFNILRGQKANLPSTKTDGRIYVTEDTGEVYFDTSNSKRIQLNANNALSANKVNKLLTIQGNGTNSFTFDGSASKTLNIKPGTAISVTSDTSGNITIGSTQGNATTSAAGLMSASDKTKLNGIATGATKITVDSTLSSTSTNPVQNKVINSALSEKANSSHSHAYLPTAGGIMTGELKTSFNGAVAMGSYQATATTIANLVNEVRYSSGCMGSVSLSSAYTKDGVTVPTGWYNFMYAPHRSGGANGAESGDNQNYGTLLLFGMTESNRAFRIRVSGGSISELRTILENSTLTKAHVTTALGYTPPTSNTTYSAGTGISLSGTTFSNSGVRSISTGTANGTISVNTNGSSANVAVKGLAAAAFKSVDTTPTSGSANVITSGGVYSALANKKNTTDKDIFYATYGSTTFAEIKAAYDAGKQIMINKVSDGALSYNYVAPLFEIDDTTATFQTYGVFPNASDLLLPKGSVWFMKSTVNSSNQWSGDFNNHIGLNRTTRIDRDDTNYTTYMARGEALYASSNSTTPTYNGTIAWYYG